jgi:beta propeller repeat protein
VRKPFLSGKSAARRLLLLPVVALMLPGVSAARPALQPDEPAEPVESTIIISEPVALAEGEGIQTVPALVGDTLYYLEAPDTSAALNLMQIDLTTGDTTELTGDYTTISPFAASEDYVVFPDIRDVDMDQDYSALSDVNIYAISVADGEEIEIATAKNMQTYPHISGNIVVWNDYRRGTTEDELEDRYAFDIYMYNLETGKETAVARRAANQIRPVSNGEIIVWTDTRNWDKGDSMCDLYAYDIATKKEFKLAGGPGCQVSSQISGNIVVWEDIDSDENSSIMGYDLTTEESFLISDAEDFQVEPLIEGNLVVWKDYRNKIGDEWGAYDIYGYDLVTGEEFLVYESIGEKGSQWTLSNGRVAWSEAIDGTTEEVGRDIISVTIEGISDEEIGQTTPQGALRPMPATRQPAMDPARVGRTAGSRIAPMIGVQENEKQISPLFRAYWQRHGALDLLGLPISDEMQEKSDLDGKIYTVQYFERALLEHHPEVSDPNFRVMAAHLGTLRYRELYGAAGAPNQRPNTAQGSVAFVQTGKRIGGKFLAFWRQNGGVVQFGYPISDEFTEKSALDGKTYTVQYFERGVLELHPENRAPHDVQLSQLGAFRYNAKHGN